MGLGSLCVLHISLLDGAICGRRKQKTVSLLTTSRGAGIWYRVQDIYHRRAGDFVWIFTSWVLGLGYWVLKCMGVA